MKLLYIITAILIPTILFSQNKTIVPKSGTIVFTSREIIIDEALHQNSMKEFKKKMLAEIKEVAELERSSTGMKTDSTQIKEALQMIDENLSSIFEMKNNLQYRHEFQGNTIHSIQSFNGEILEEKTIDTKMAMKDNTEYYSFNKVVDLREFKNERKKINGYDCFKITYSYKEESSSGLNDFLSGYLNHRELWVTEKIKYAFHPVINDRLILEKYYPLEITEHSDAIKGSETKYELIKLEIQ